MDLVVLAFGSWMIRTRVCWVALRKESSILVLVKRCHSILPDCEFTSASFELPARIYKS